ncbi:MAG: hypothetical protein M3N46_09925 [Actinomycetota bacterium]|nr:hypothetical protein [Actinomycetota bacterium]
MTNTETLVRTTVTHTQLGWLYSRNRLSNRLDDMFGIAARIDHQVRAAFTSQVKAARITSSFDEFSFRYEVLWCDEYDDDIGESFASFVVATPRTATSESREVVRFRLAATATDALALFATRPAAERRFILTRDLFTMDRWTLSLVSARFALDIRFAYEPKARATLRS